MHAGDFSDFCRPQSPAIIVGDAAEDSLLARHGGSSSSRKEDSEVERWVILVPRDVMVQRLCNFLHQRAERDSRGPFRTTPRSGRGSLIRKC